MLKHKSHIIINRPYYMCLLNPVTPSVLHAFLFIRIYFIRILKMKWDKKLRIS